ncbi:MAG TPA: hypothetical protein VFU41_05250 [Gemmatimonadales bacterium]|nr:hypothetical protein [Gemmatimonadales bacterium]
MRASIWTTDIVYAGLLGGALLGCRSRTTDDAFLATRVPVARLDSVLRAADSVRLPLADARTLFEVLQDVRLAVNLPRDTMTIAEILAWARAEHARTERANAEATAVERAREEGLKRQLDSLLAVTVLSKRYVPKDPDAERYEDYISLTLAYRNTGTKAIRAFQGDVTFLDALGDTIYSAHLKVDGPLAPGRTQREPGRIIKYNPLRIEHQRLRNTVLSEMKVAWQSSDVTFTDGSRVSLAGDPEAP